MARLQPLSNDHLPLLVDPKGRSLTSPAGSSVDTQSTTLRTTELGPDLDDITFSGSGSGKPMLVPSTAAREVRLETLIGSGRFGQVWKGKWRCDDVAAKIFSSRDEQSWTKERLIYETMMLRHANILGFITTDNKDTGLATELWLITDYHRLGSLFEFLQLYAMSPHGILRMAASVVN
ncbi:Activin receptor type-1C, partial [Cichlidogyrus casuarinus]